MPARANRVPFSRPARLALILVLAAIAFNAVANGVVNSMGRVGPTAVTVGIVQYVILLALVILAFVLGVLGIRETRDREKRGGGVAIAAVVLSVLILVANLVAIVGSIVLPS